MTPHVGMKVWRFDMNRREYERDARGRAVGGPIWRKHWVEEQIVGETRVSWIVGPEWMREPRQLSRALKVPKKDWPGSLAVSEEDIDKAAYVEGRHRIAERIRDCRDYDTLKAVEAALDALNT